MAHARRARARRGELRRIWASQSTLRQTTSARRPSARGGLFFVEQRGAPGSMRTGRHLLHPSGQPVSVWAEPPAPPSALRPARTASSTSKGPSWVDVSGKLTRKKLLYFSRSSVAPNVPGEIYVSERQNGARFGPAHHPVRELNDAAANDIQPNVRADGLELVLSSNRSGTLGGSGRLGPRHARRPVTPWSAPVNLGSAVNTERGRDTGRRCRRTGTSCSSGARPAPREAATST